MKTNLTITAAGKAALTATGAAGPDAVEITGIAVGLAPRVLTDITGVTALQSEITRTDFRGDAGASPGSIAGYGLFEGGAAWSALEIGVYATVGNADEILFAYALAVANTAGVRVPLLTKTAGEDARYDFAFIFSPASAAAPTPCAAPSPTPCSVPSPCFTPPYYYAPPPPPVPLPVPTPPAPPPPPLKRRVWLSVNTRQPYDDDVAHPVGHIWRWGKNEWQLESITDGEAQWQLVRGTEELYSISNTPSNSTTRATMPLPISSFTWLSLHFKHTGTSLYGYDHASPLNITSTAFIAGQQVVSSEEVKTAAATYVGNNTIELYRETSNFYINKIYGVY